MESFVLSVAQSREVDRVAIERLGIPGLVLMENAGRGAADVLCQRGAKGPITIFCGGGNNGGDGLVIARHLATRGIKVGVVLVPPMAKLSGDALTNANILRGCDVPIVELADEGGPTAITEALDYFLDEPAEWIVDALLGTGALGAPRPPYDSIIEWINAESSRRLAVDVPSGLDADTGEPSPTTIKADLTVTFVASKAGFATPQAQGHLGELVVADIGVPLEAVLPYLGV
jgi:NAD(P)H-hydrate epimerase